MIHSNLIALKSVFCIANEILKADEIIDLFRASGCSRRTISVLFLNRSKGWEPFEHQDIGLSDGLQSRVGERRVVRGTLGWLVGIGAIGWLDIGSILLPGVGPFTAAGPMLAALRGVVEGSERVLMPEALIQMGVPEYEAHRYEARLLEGAVLISVHSESPTEIAEAKRIFAEALGHQSEADRMAGSAIRERVSWFARHSEMENTAGYRVL